MLLLRLLSTTGDQTANTLIDSIWLLFSNCLKKEVILMGKKISFFRLFSGELLPPEIHVKVNY